MRALLIAVILAALGWSTYWWVGSSAQQKALNAWLQDRRAAGWQADVESLSVRGYPNRYDTVIKNLELADPRQGWAWRAQDFRIMALSYKPNHIIAAFPGRQVFSTLTDTITFSSDSMRASVIFKPQTSLALDRLQLESAGTVFQGANGWKASTEALNAAFFATPETSRNGFPVYDLYAQATNLKPARSWLRRIDPANLLPPVIPQTLVDASLTFDRAWDRFAIETRNPVLKSIKIRDIRFEWGALELRGAGKVAVTAAGYPEGRVTLQIKKWRDLLQVATAAGMFNPEVAGNIEKALGFIAGIAGNPETIEVPLRFANGKTYIGPVPIGAAPLLRF